MPRPSPHTRLLQILTCAAVAGCVAGCSSKKRPPEQDEVLAPIPLEAISTDLPKRELPEAQKEEQAPPLSLTASDGTGLRLVSVKARAVVEEPIAFTELHLEFANPNPRTIEGRFTIDLPTDAAISRFAMKIGNQWQEGEVVERQAARVAYEDFLHRKQDPALLEKQAGNRFSARVFPIPGNAKKELIVSYSQELSDSKVPYRMMLRGLPKLDKLDAQITIDRPKAGKVGGATTIGGTAATRSVITVNEENFTPDRDLEVEATATGKAIGIRHDNLALARVRATGDLPEQAIKDLTILFDTSASRALGFSGQLRRLGALVKALREKAGGSLRLRVVAFDQTAALVFDGDAAEFGEGHLHQMYARRAMGASDLTGALTRLARVGTLSPRVLVVSDGIATAGESEASEVKAAVKSLQEAGVARVDALVDGGLRDEDMLGAVVTAGLPQQGTVVDARLSPKEIADKLSLATISRLSVSVPGASWAWPKEVKGVQPGDEILVYAKLPAGKAMKVVLEGEDTIEAEVATTKVSKPLLQRAWVGAQIESMTFQRSELGKDRADEAERIKKEIVEVSTRHRVLSDFTALLVLETEADYRRFNIDRKSLADILTVGATGIELIDRKGRDPVATSGVIGWRRDNTPSRTTTAPQPPGSPPHGESDDDAGGLGQRHRGEEGRMGKPKSKKKSGLYAMKGPRDEARMQESKQDFDPSKSDEAEAFGVGGLGLVGTGRGGGGTGEGTIGLGNTGLIGKGGGGGTGSGYGRGSGAGFGGRGKRVPRVRMAKATVSGDLDKDIIRRIVRAHINEVRHCFNQGLAKNAGLHGRVEIRFQIAPTGKVAVARVHKHNIADEAVTKCTAKAVKRWKFPKPRSGGIVTVIYPFILNERGDGPLRAPRDLSPAELEQQREEEAALIARMEAEAAEQRRKEEARRKREEAERAEARRTEGSPYSGKMFDIMQMIDKGDAEQALVRALKWHDEAPGDVLALIATGEALEAAGKPVAAERAYGSLIDLFPARADLRRHAGTRLERVNGVASKLVVDNYRRAAEQRPDHPSGPRMLAYALVRAGQHEKAFDTIVAAAKRDYPSNRFAGVKQILNEDIGLIASAWAKADPKRKGEIEGRVRGAGARFELAPSTRFIMTWETDANDVDFHIYDGKDGHAYYSDKTLESGGKLYADVTTGYGPECFNIPGKPAAFPYRFEANYYSRGPMGYGMGALQIVQHDGMGGLLFEDRPFIIMKDRAFVKLGDLQAPLK